MDIKAYISSGIIESYVLGLASEEEVSILNCIRKNNVEVEQAIAEAEIALEGLADIQAMAMPASLKDNIWNKLVAEDAITTAGDEQITESTDLPVADSQQIYPQEESVKQIVTHRNRFYPWTIAASVLLALSVGANFFLYQEHDENKDTLAKVSAAQEAQAVDLAILQDKWKLVQNPEIKTVSLKGVENQSDLHALVFWDHASQMVYLSLEHMPAAPKGKQYQLWAMVDGKPVNAGLFPLDAKVGMASKMLNIKMAQAFAITLEDEGGKPVPTLSQLRVMGSI